MTDLYLRPQRLAKAEIEQAQSVGHDCAELAELTIAVSQKVTAAFA